MDAEVFEAMMHLSLARLLEEAFEAGHWSWPTPDEPTRRQQRERFVREAIAREFPAGEGQ